MTGLQAIDERVATLLGVPVVTLRRIESRGYAAAFHAIAELDDGRTAFVKAGAEQVTSEFLREEIRFYRSVSAPFMPMFYGADDADPPILVVEDLSTQRWPPPWDADSIAAVRSALAGIAATPTPAGVPSIEADREWLVGGWAVVEQDPGPFLSLGVCERAWLDDALADLRRAAETAPIAGDALLHLDVRSDNICLADRGAVLVDWNLAHVGNPDLDVAAWLPSLHLEGGPLPDVLLAGAGGFAALLAGFFGCRAGLPAPPTAPHVRSIQLAQLRVALPWARRELGL